MMRSRSLSISVEQHHVYKITMRGVRKMHTIEGKSARNGRKTEISQSGLKRTTQTVAIDTTESNRTSLMKCINTFGPMAPKAPKSCSCFDGFLMSTNTPITDSIIDVSFTTSFISLS